MNPIWKLALAAAFVAALYAVAGTKPAVADDTKKIEISGAFYTKWLWGTLRRDQSLYNFSTVGEEPGGDNGQGTEIEIFIKGRISKMLSFDSRIHSRFSQNFWTNFGGFGVGNNGGGSPGNCVGGDCGELDPRSNRYIKLRGFAFYITPGWRGIDTITVGTSDLGMWDPFTVGKIRYIDRDNAAGVFVQGSTKSKKFMWDASRISLPRLWAGPNFNTGSYTAADGLYVVQGKVNVNPKWDLTAVAYYTNDIEVDPQDVNFYNGTNVKTRFRNTVGGLRFAVRPSSTVDVSGLFYQSWNDSNPNFGAPGSFSTYFGFSPVIAGKADDNAYKLDVNLNNLGGSGFGLALEGFNFGAKYTSMMASRREADVLITEGWDATWMLPGLDNNTFAAFPSNRSQIGYGGFNGTRQQLATINVDNNFADFDEPLAETVIGWKGATIVPKWNRGSMEIAAEYTYITYNTNWQAYGDPSRFIGDTIYPSAELDAGVLHNYRTAYAPFQDKKTQIAVLRYKNTYDVGKGLDVFAKIKYIKETDDRMTDPNFLPYVAGDCPANPAVDEGCGNVKHLYNGVNSTADSNSGGPGLYENPPVIVGANGQVGYQWKPFDSVSDDDRDLKYWHGQIGVGYQFTDKFYGSFQYDYYDADLHDGNSAFQAYGVHQWASGKNVKNSLDVIAKYNIASGCDFGFEYQYLFGTFTPDFGTGFVPQVADAQDHALWGADIGSLGFRGRSFYGSGNYVWNSLEKIDLSQQRIKAFLKINW